MMAVNLKEFSAGELPSDIKDEYLEKYSLDDRKRDPWNHYGAIALALAVIGGGLVKGRKRREQP